LEEESAGVAVVVLLRLGAPLIVVAVFEVAALATVLFGAAVLRANAALLLLVAESVALVSASD
jgi:hypothetical protein